MATLSASSSFNMGTMSGGSLITSTLTSTFFRVDTDGYQFHYSGSFTLSDGTPSAGTVTSLKVYSVGTSSLTLIANFTGLSASAPDVWDSIDMGDWTELLGLLFNGNDSLVGSTGNDVLSGYAGDDTLKGSGGKDSLVGGDGNDVINGGGSRDTMEGGLGNDTFYVDRRLDVVTEESNGGTDTVYSTSTYKLSNNVENLILTGVDAINGFGNDLDNTLTGNSAANVLSGGNGNDLYIVDALDTVSESSSGGLDTVQADFDYTLGNNIENLILTGSTAIYATANTLNNTVTGNSAANIMYGMNGDDAMYGGTGNDTINGGNGNDVLEGQTGNDKLIGWVGGDTLVGGDGNDKLYGDNVPTQTLPASEPLVPATHSLVAGLSANQFATYADMSASAMDMAQVMQAETSGITVTSAKFTGAGEAASVFSEVNFDGSGSFQLGQGILLTSGDGSPNASNTSTGYTQSNGLEGDTQLDEVASAAFAGSGTTNDATILEFTFIVSGSSPKISLDLMFGSEEYPEWSDSSFVDIAAVWIDGVNYALFNNDTEQPLSVISENLGVGNFYDNSTGALSIEYDGVSSPLRIVGSLDSSLTEHTIRIAIADTGDTALDSGIFLSNLQVRDASYSNGIAPVSGYNDYLSGGAGDDLLDGSAGSDTLDGGIGIDTMSGGAGNDLYIVDNASDVVSENAGEGTDMVHSYIDFTLSANVENLTLVGGAGATGTGSNLNNVLVGNLADNALNGMGGNDTLIGGGGNDTLDGGNGIDTVSYASATTQVVVDLSSTSAQNTRAAGTDTLLNIENVIGGSGNDYLFGSNGANVLDGGKGNDSMRGGAGDDTYIIDSEGDVAVELQGQGTDTVVSSVSWTLGACIENLTLTGTDDIDATGNASGLGLTGANVIIGNDGNNTISGLSGADTLTGGLGRDSFVFSTPPVPGEVDVITDFTVADDMIALDTGAFAALSGIDWMLEGCTHFVIGTAAGDADDFLIYDSSTGALYYDEDGSGATAATQFASVGTGLYLSAANFDV